MRRDALIFTRIASGALVLVFVALLVFTVLGALAIKRAARETKSAVSLSQRYEYVDRQLWKEASLVRVHGVNWQNANWYANVYEEHAAAVAIEASLTEIAQNGAGRDRNLAVRTLADHDRYADMLRQLFAQIDSSAPNAAATFDRSARLFDSMQAQVERRASEQHAAAMASLAELDATQTRIVRLILSAGLIGGVLLVVSLGIILRYRHVIETSRSAELRRLAKESLTDTLTGLGNHRAYQNHLEQQLEQGERRGKTLSLALIDVDNFKTINDTKGHIQGDKVLGAVGELLVAIRDTDRGFRLGGDEFAIVLPDTDLSEAVATMERLRLEAARSLDGCTISIGIASAQGRRIDAVTLRMQADTALYEAKRRGRNGTVRYTVALGVNHGGRRTARTSVN